MSTPKFADTHNLVAFLEKPEESNGFKEIIDFLNASSVQYALTVNPTIHTSCIEQFRTTAKVKMINGERQLQALVDKKKVIITETSIRSDLNLEDTGGTDYLPTDTIFEELARMGAKTTAWHEFSSTMASAIICLATNQNFNLSKYIFDAMLGDMSHHKKDYVNPSHTKKIFTNIKREGKDFSGRVTPLFATMMVQANQEEEPMTEKETNKESVPIHSYDPSQSGEDRMQLHELMNLCTKLANRVLALETTKTTQALEIASLKSAKEDASKQGRKITDLDVDAEVTLVDETQEMNDDNLMFDIGVLEEHEKDVAEKEVSVVDPVTTAGEVVTTTNVEVTTVNAPTTTIDELTLAQTLIEIKAAKPKVVTSTATTTTTTRPNARRVVVQEPSEFKTTSSSLQASQLPLVKDKGKGIIVEPEVPLKKKDQVALDEEMARNLEA
ncbi:hypothetical protein Tco_0940499 [Tanacetum coccineum]|uniref:Uncharacterized protein n=1 Tax=Tanacetum coccineum TaxID=301880 RepID=A0ABQ5DU88_9ASTR